MCSRLVPRELFRRGGLVGGQESSPRLTVVLAGREETTPAKSMARGSDLLRQDLGLDA